MAPSTQNRSEGTDRDVKRSLMDEAGQDGAHPLLKSEGRYGQPVSEVEELMDKIRRILR
jgi:hypothetical protein